MEQEAENVKFYDQTGDGEYNDWKAMKDAFEAKEAEVERLRYWLREIEWLRNFEGSRRRNYAPSGAVRKCLPCCWRMEVPSEASKPPFPVPRGSIGVSGGMEMTVDQMFREMLGEGPLENVLCRIAIDIQEHPEWPYYVIAGYIKNSLLAANVTLSIPAASSQDSSTA